MQMQTPYGSPDSLRQFLQLSKKFYQLHTPRDFGYEDCDGLQYVGSIHNFGSEMLLETRKLRMRKPPIPIIRPSEYFSYYFNISYSDFIEAYNQPNMVMGCVKRDVMLSDHTYKLVFENCELLYVNRADAYSDTDVRVSKFYATYTTPKLVIDDIEEYPIYIGKYDNEDHHARWFFAINKTTENLYTRTTVNFNTTITTVDMKSYVDLPFVWVCDSQMNMYPPVEITTSSSVYLEMYRLEHGMDGHDVDHLYPLEYFGLPDDQQFWYLKVYGDFLSLTDERNYGVEITRIEFISCATESYTDEPTSVKWFVYDDEFVKISLHENDEWIFRKPEPGDYDYDGESYNNPIVACIPLRYFESNHVTLSNMDPILIPAFDVIFNEKYYHKFETQINQMRVGIHLDHSTDKSDHTVDKHYGIVYDLSKFDGLPNYYYRDIVYGQTHQKVLEKTMHHSHMELYAIRDDANSKIVNKDSYNRQTSAILIDTGIPVNTMASITADMEPVIYYDGTKDRTYSTDESKIVSTMNYLSNVVYVDDNTFGDKTMRQYKSNQPFVYHGNGRFSLGVIDTDPDTEYGRCFLITNDPIGYENNATSKHPKSPLAAARICDIPTSFTQLQNITGESPTLVIDKYYVSQKASFNKEEFVKLWNGCVSRWLKPEGVSTNAHYISTLWILNHFAGDEGTVKRLCGDVYHYEGTGIDELNEIFLHDTIVTITDPGHGYDVGDNVGFNIGGVFIRCTITVVTPIDNGIQTFTMEWNSSIPSQDDGSTLSSVIIPLANFQSNVTLYDLTTLSGYGSEAKISITIPTPIWNNFKASEIYADGRYYYKLINTPDGLPPAGWDQAYFNYYTQSGEYPNYVYTQVPYGESAPVWENNKYYYYSISQKRTLFPTPDVSCIYSFIRQDDVEGISAIGYNSSTTSWDESTITQITGDREIGCIYYDDASTRSKRTILNTYLRNMLTNRNYAIGDILGTISGTKQVQLNYKLMDYDPPEKSIEKLYDGSDMKEWMNDAGLNTMNSFMTLVPSRESYRSSKCYAITWQYDHIDSENDRYNVIFPSRSKYIYENNYDNTWSGIRFNVQNGKVIPYMYDIMHSTIDTYDFDGSVLKLSDQRKATLQDIVKTTSPYPSDAESLHGGLTLNFNLYRYDHLEMFHEMKEMRHILYQYTSDQLYQIAIDMFGEDTMVTKYYGYATVQYEPETVYAMGVLITDHLTTVDYEMNHVYAENTMILNPLTDEMYRAIKPFVSSNVNNDLQQSLYRDITLQDKLYRALRTFTSTTIDDDIQNGNIKYIGISQKSKDIINYITQNYEIENQLSGYAIPYNNKSEQMHIKEDDAIGGFVPLLDTVEDMNTVNGGYVHVNPLYIFRMDNVDTFELQKLRVFDGDIDVSEQSMLIIKDITGQYKKYVFHNDAWEWYYS